MDKTKQMWKSIYYLVYTEGYKIISIDEEEAEIWLTHESKKLSKGLYIRRLHIKKLILT